MRYGIPLPLLAMIKKKPSYQEPTKYKGRGIGETASVHMVRVRDAKLPRMLSCKVTVSAES